MKKVFQRDRIFSQLHSSCVQPKQNPFRFIGRNDELNHFRLSINSCDSQKSTPVAYRQFEDIINKNKSDGTFAISVCGTPQIIYIRGAVASKSGTIHPFLS